MISSANCIEIDHVLTLFAERYIETYLTEITHFDVSLGWDHLVEEVARSFEKTQKIISFELNLVYFVNEYLFLFLLFLQLNPQNLSTFHFGMQMHLYCEIVGLYLVVLWELWLFILLIHLLNIIKAPNLIKKAKIKH